MADLIAIGYDDTTTAVQAMEEAVLTAPIARMGSQVAHANELLGGRVAVHQPSVLVDDGDGVADARNGIENPAALGTAPVRAAVHRAECYRISEDDVTSARHAGRRKTISSAANDRGAPGRLQAAAGEQKQSSQRPRACLEATRRARPRARRGPPPRP